MVTNVIFILSFNILTCILKYARPPTPLMFYGNRIEG